MAEFFNQIFNWLPLAHVINHKIFVVHGGLFSSDEVTLDDLRKIDRNRQPPDSGPMCVMRRRVKFSSLTAPSRSSRNEMLWSDPFGMSGRGPSPRGTGMQFGPDVTKAFLKKNNLELVIRSHQVGEGGKVQWEQSPPAHLLLHLLS